MPDRSPIYLDNHATTRTDPRVVEAMLPYFTESYGNASSLSHPMGRAAFEAVERARESVARLVGVETREVVFTSGATEANNLALQGGLASLRKRGDHVVSCAAEHKAVLDPLNRLSRDGWRLTLIPPDVHGMATAESVMAAIEPGTVLVSIMAANNEVGTINPIGAIASACRDRGVVFHTDAVQAAGRIPLDLASVGADLASLSAHKFYGPKGVGALIVRRTDRRVRPAPLFDGGGQERGLRPGTLPVPLIVGMGAAAEIALADMEADSLRVRGLRDRLHDHLRAKLDGLRLNGHPTERLPGNLNLSFEGVHGEALMLAMGRLCVSSGSACSASDPEPSHVLTAMGIGEDLARASLRFGLGRFTTAEEVVEAAEMVSAAVGRLRTRSSL